MVWEDQADNDATRQERRKFVKKKSGNTIIDFQRTPFTAKATRERHNPTIADQLENTNIS